MECYAMTTFSLDRWKMLKMFTNYNNTIDDSSDLVNVIIPIILIEDVSSENSPENKMIYN